MVRPYVERADGSILLEEVPPIPNVPVVWPRGGGGYYLHFPLRNWDPILKEGDYVMLLFAELAMAHWRVTGQLSPPGDLSRHDWSYPVAFPGIAPDAEPLQDVPADEAVLIVPSGKRLRVSAAGADADFVALAAKVKRCHEARTTDGVRSVKDEWQRLKAYAIPDLGRLETDKIDTGAINATLDACKKKGKSKGTVQHLKQDIANVFAMLKREGAIKANPAIDAELPKFSKQRKKIREVLTDEELVVYLGWTHPEKQWQRASLERQVMVCVSRMFGGLRTGDLHALDWSALDTTDGRFEWAWAPRRKTEHPQKLEIPVMLRPILRLWWQLAKSDDFPKGAHAGPCFPVSPWRTGRGGEVQGEPRQGVPNGPPASVRGRRARLEDRDAKERQEAHEARLEAGSGAHSSRGAALRGNGVHAPDRLPFVAAAVLPGACRCRCERAASDGARRPRLARRAPTVPGERFEGPIDPRSGAPPDWGFPPFQWRNWGGGKR